MEKLITDSYIRFCAMGVLLSGLLVLLSLQGGFLILLLGTLNDWFLEQPRILQFDLAILKFPFKDEFSSFTAAAAGILPVAISAVCFKVTGGITTSDFNNIGRAAVTLLLLGATLGVVAKILQQVYSTDIGLMAGNTVDATAVRSTLTMILGFDVLYCTQLMGIKR